MRRVLPFELWKCVPGLLVVNVLQQVGSAFDASHLQGIIHRDMSPEDIRLEPVSLRGIRVRVLEFEIPNIVDTLDLTAFGNKELHSGQGKAVTLFFPDG